jgi:hypothetical protein
MNWPMTTTDTLRKDALQSLRLATDCMQLAGDIPNPALQRHFLRMAGVWTSRAEGETGMSSGRPHPARALAA